VDPARRQLLAFGPGVAEPVAPAGRVFWLTPRPQTAALRSLAARRRHCASGWPRPGSWNGLLFGFVSWVFVL